EIRRSWGRCGRGTPSFWCGGSPAACKSHSRSAFWPGEAERALPGYGGPHWWSPRRCRGCRMARRPPWPRELTSLPLRLRSWVECRIQGCCPE
uniref:Uncharacterized protein n=1 Tax=Electrophorus electricus TaxID=8005 RepID=A0AAY5EA80_ELEEL